jgi:hypothetical protein
MQAPYSLLDTKDAIDQRRLPTSRLQKVRVLIRHFLLMKKRRVDGTFPSTNMRNLRDRRQSAST